MTGGLLLADSGLLVDSLQAFERHRLWEYAPKFVGAVNIAIRTTPRFDRQKADRHDGPRRRCMLFAR
jgi:hypothetical protein